MNQIPIAEWPSALAEEVAVLQQEVADLESNPGIHFEESFDDLDYFKAAIISPPHGRPFALKRYRNSPAPGVSIIVGSSRDELLSSMNDALIALGLRSDSLTWMRADLRC